MSDDKYVGIDVHLATVVVAVLDAGGKCVMDAVIETKGQTILAFIDGLRETLHVVFEEGTQSAWLYDLLGPRVAEVVVCNTRKHEKIAGENHADRADASRLANWLRLGEVKAVYKGERGLRDLKELVHCYDYLVRDITRVCESDQGGLSEPRDRLPRARRLSGARAGDVARRVERAGAPDGEPSCSIGSWTGYGCCGEMPSTPCSQKRSDTEGMRCCSEYRRSGRCGRRRFWRRSGRRIGSGPSGSSGRIVASGS